MKESLGQRLVRLECFLHASQNHPDFTYIVRRHVLSDPDPTLDMIANGGWEVNVNCHGGIEKDSRIAVHYMRKYMAGSPELEVAPEFVIVRRPCGCAALSCSLNSDDATNKSQVDRAVKRSAVTPGTMIEFISGDQLRFACPRCEKGVK